MHTTLHRIACLCFTLAALAGVAGCEAIVSFDRSKIPDGGGAEAGTDMGRDLGMPVDGGLDTGTPDLGLCTSAASCDDSDVCTTDACDTGTMMCTHTTVTPCCHNDGDCDDSMFCTTDACDMTLHTCTNNRMTSCCDSAADCDDGLACSTDTCDTTGHTCMHSSCPCTMMSECVDTNACTTDACDTGSGLCTNTMIVGCCLGAGDCSDGDTCTTDTCTGSMTCDHAPIAGCCNTAADCDDTNPCTDDACDSGTSMCTHTNNAATCTGGTCNAGACCTGCIDGTGCQTGSGDSACGSAGGACSDCTASAQTCSGGTCMSPPPDCTTYCTTVMASCTGANAQYGGIANCMNACAHFGWALGSVSPPDSGDTVGCRQYHATVAGMPGMAAMHCPHAGPVGAGTCGPGNCASWCAANIAVCGTAAYADMGTCMTACGAWPDMSMPDLSMTDMQFNCRVYHLTAAAATGGATGHCPHTTVGGAGVCPP